MKVVYFAKRIKMVNVDSTAENVVDDLQSMTSEDELHSNENVAGRFKFDDETAINNEEDLVKLNLMDLRLEEYIIRFHFPDLNVAFMFYKWYGSMRGFSARKCRMMKNCRGEITQQTFVCHEEVTGEKNTTTEKVELEKQNLILDVDVRQNIKSTLMTCLGDGT